METLDYIAELRAAIAEAGSASAFGRQHGISASYICDALKGRRHPGQKILQALKIEEVTTYRRTA